MIDSVPRFLNGAFPFSGAGYDAPAPLHASMRYVVPSTRRAQLIYMRAGNSSDEMIVLSMMQDGKPVRLFPLAAKGAGHVPLAVVEDLQPETTLELHVAAPSGCSGTVVVDVGLMEI